MHQRLRIFLEPFHGVSTRWLGRYLDCFRWLEQARHSDADRGDTLSGQVARGSYGSTRCIQSSKSRQLGVVPEIRTKR